MAEISGQEEDEKDQPHRDIPDGADEFGAPEPEGGDGAGGHPKSDGEAMLHEDGWAEAGVAFGLVEGELVIAVDNVMKLRTKADFVPAERARKSCRR